MKWHDTILEGLGLGTWWGMQPEDVNPRVYSPCCGVPVQVGGKGMTRWYQCSKCLNPIHDEGCRCPECDPDYNSPEQIARDESRQP